MGATCYSGIVVKLTQAVPTFSKVKTTDFKHCITLLIASCENFIRVALVLRVRLLKFVQRKMKKKQKNYGNPMILVYPKALLLAVFFLNCKNCEEHKSVK